MKHTRELQAVDLTDATGEKHSKVPDCVRSIAATKLNGMTEVTQILSRIDQGDVAASAELLPLVYQELRKLAAVHMAGERSGQTLQATALVHEAYLRLVDVENPQKWDNRRHFFGAAAEAMRRILVDNARRKQAVIHGGGRQRVGLSDGDWFSQATPEQIVELDDSFTKLAADDPMAAEIAKLRVFAGMSVEEAAECLGLPRATAYRHWTYARAFLRHERSG